MLCGVNFFFLCLTCHLLFLHTSIQVGYTITPKQALTVTSLGRAVSGRALKADAAVNIWSARTKKVVATALVGPAASVTENGFAYADLHAPVVLPAGQTYYVTQTCTPNMPDLWTNTGDNAKEAETLLAALGKGVYSNNGSPGAFPTNQEKDSQFAGIVTFKARVPPNPHPTPASACVCSVPAAPFGRGTGTIKYLTSGEQIGFPFRCEPYPRETVLRDQNPTCDIRTYAGGLSTCHHGWHLLDGQ